MKVWKEKTGEKSHNIYIQVGKAVYKSFWSSPPKNSEHVDLEYLKERYPIITTEKRAAEFKRLFKMLWIEVSDEQKRKMRHALGLDNSKRAYRNRYQTSKDDSDWNELLEKGLAAKGKEGEYGLVWFWLTKDGAEFVLGKKISNKVYEEL